MSAEACSHYLETAISAYAKDNVASGRWPQEGALARSRAEFDSLLPQGLQTPDNHLFEIREAKTTPVIGFLWFAIVESRGQRTAFVYDIEIMPAYRRRGYAGAAFEALEHLVCQPGLSRIGLYVLAIMRQHRPCTASWNISLPVSIC